DDEIRGPASGYPMQAPHRAGRLAVLETDCGSKRHLRDVDERCMVELVEEHHIGTADEARNHAEIGLIAGREDEARFLVEELCQLGFELFVEIEGAVEEAAAGAT